MDVLLVSLITAILYLVYLLITKNNNYWQKKNVPYVKPIPIFGNYFKYILLQEYVGQLVQKLCDQFPNAPYFGAFFGTEPVLIVQCPKLLKQILTKDFYYFNGREVSKYDIKEAITQGLFFTGGDRWKVVRQNVSPLFSSAKMKNMFYLIKKCSNVFEDMLDSETKNSLVVEAKDISTRFTMDCVSSCAFGIETNTMTNPENNSFKFMGDEIFRPSDSRGLKLVFRSIWPAILYGLGFKCFPDTIVTFFSQLLKGVFKSRNHEPSSRHDFVDLVLSLKKLDKITTDSMSNVKTGLDEKVYMVMDDEVLLAQCITFFGAGFETSAATLGFVLYELARNPEVQEQAAEEVIKYLHRHDNELKYDCITELPYLEACLCETLRKFPVLGHLAREVMDDYKFPDGLQLEKGIRIHVPVYSLHHNPDYFPEPESFKPERFLPENRDEIIQYTYLPFGEGPRICIGKRFSKMLIIPGLITILKKYRLELAEGMPKEFTFECRATVTQPRNQGLMLKAIEREGWEHRMFIRT